MADLSQVIFECDNPQRVYWVAMNYNDRLSRDETTALDLIIRKYASEHGAQGAHERLQGKSIARIFAEQPYPYLGGLTPEEERAAATVRSIPNQWGQAVESNDYEGNPLVLEIDAVRPGTPEEYAAIAQMKHVHRIRVNRAFATDELMEAIGQLPKLTNFHCYEADQITDRGLSFLANHPALGEFQLRKASITDAGLKPFGTIPTLWSLHLTESQLTNAALEPLGDLQNLGHLQLGASTIDDEGLKLLARLSGLRLLGLYQSQVRGFGFKQLHGLKHLASLHLWKNPIDDEGIVGLAGLPQVTFFGISEAPLTDEAVKNFVAAGGMPKLEMLQLVKTQVTGISVGQLASLPRLKALWLNGCPLVREAIPEIGKIARLKQLQVAETSFGKSAKAEIKVLLPKCVVYTDGGDDVDEEDEENAPWNDPNYYWKHPPECIQGFKLTKKKEKGMSEGAVRFQLACKCGHGKGELLGHSYPSGELFASPLIFRCGKCAKETPIFDAAEHGYNAQIGSSMPSHRGEGEPDVYVCSTCERTLWVLQASFMHDDGAHDLWYDDPEIALEDYFGWFSLRGVCAKCKETREMADFETA